MTFRGALGKLLLLASCVSLVVAFAASAAAAAPLQIAVEGPQSGDQAANGLDQLRGVRLAVRQLNARGGLWDGRKVAVLPVDDRGDAATATAVARRAIAKGARFVIGPYNSSVALANLPLYRRSHVLPLWMSSRDDTAGVGATLQAMNSQISPVEQRFVERLRPRRVAMLVDATANGAFTKEMAGRLRMALVRAGAAVTSTSVREGQRSGYYAGKVAAALSTKPDWVYVSSYFPEGAQIAKALAAAHPRPRCLLGLSNVDNGFLAHTTLAEAQRCVFSGEPAATELPSATQYARDYQATFRKTPGVWGTFTYDSARILFAAINRARSYQFAAVERRLRQTTGYGGATGSVTIEPRTGYRRNVPVSILRVDAHKRFVIEK
jgi:branched-chain amino acid transport system substrate-binding protein